MAMRLRRAMAWVAGLGATAALAVGIARSQRPTRAQVRRVTVALHPRARAHVTRALDGMGASADISTPVGRAEAARRVCLLLSDEAGATERAFAQCETLAADDAPPRFDALADDLRARYEHETRRNAETRLAPAVAPDAGPGLLVVTVLVGVEAPDTVHTDVSTRAALRSTLATLVPSRGGLAALEVIWSPSVDEDALSPETVTARYPELTALREVAG